MWQEVQVRNRYFPLEKWLVAWLKIHRLYKNVHLIITGGEPFIYPSFAELIQGVSGYFSVGFDTNLSCREEELVNFIKKVRSLNISIALSFHPAFADFSSFLKKALLLKRQGYDVYVQYVGYPAQLGQMANFRDSFIENGLRFVPLPFRGTYNGKSYPAAYTQEERGLIYETAGGLEENYKARLERMLNQVKSKGRLCRAGQHYARIDCDGTVFRCGHYTTSHLNRPMGNIFDEDFRLLEGPLPCEQMVCPCEFRFLV
jgi:MoaA/NifB/PqqE/SkfB family radical SAM enzyme